MENNCKIQLLSQRVYDSLCIIIFNEYYHIRLNLTIKSLKINMVVQYLEYDNFLILICKNIVDELFMQSTDS